MLSQSINQNYLSRATNPTQVSEAKRNAAKTLEVVAEVQSVKDIFLSARDNNLDLLPGDPRKVVVDIPKKMGPRFEKTSSKIAWKVAQFLVPPLWFVSNTVEKAPAVKGVGFLSEDGRLEKLSAKRGQDSIEYVAQGDDEGFRVSYRDTYIDVNSIDHSIRTPREGTFSHTVTRRDGDLDYNLQISGPVFPKTLESCVTNGYDTALYPNNA